MDGRHFDDLVRSLSIQLPRRRLGALAAGVIATLSGTAAGSGDAEAKRRTDKDGASGAGKGKDKTCTPAGGACASVLSAGSKPRPCCDGMTCTNNRCVGAGDGCPAGYTDCDDKCGPAGSCCPLCPVDDYCKDRYCMSLGCDDQTLSTCLDAATQKLADGIVICKRACRDTASSGCRECLGLLLSEPQLSPVACYAKACQSWADSAAPRDLTCSYSQLGSCLQGVSDKILKEAIDDVLDAPVRDGVSDLQDCLRNSRCGSMLESVSRRLWFDLESGPQDLLYKLAGCESDHGCPNGDGRCTLENLCCSPGQEVVNGTCCHVGNDGNCLPDNACPPTSTVCNFPGLGRICCLHPQICGAQYCECTNGGEFCQTEENAGICCRPSQYCSNYPDGSGVYCASL